MRKPEKYFDKIPQDLLECQSQNSDELLESKGTTTSKTCYKKAREKLLVIYHEKCAYCESKYLAVTDTWLDHYRPKSHYYWLAYEWTNLLPACPKCNRNKRDKFPIGKSKINSPFLINSKIDFSKNVANQSPLKDEKPLILHPAIDHANEHFDFELTTKGVILKSKTERAEKTISACKLNRQEGKQSGLPLARQKIIDDLFNQIINIAELAYGSSAEQEVLIKTILPNIFSQLLSNAENEKLEHTFLRKYLVNSEENFEKIICKYIEKKHKISSLFLKVLLISFTKFLNTKKT